MEKGFNDDELADIMSEIESLEQEFAEDDKDDVTAHQSEPVHDSEEVAPQDEDVEEVVAETNEPIVHAEPVQEVVAEKPQIDEKMDEVLDELSQMPVERSVPKNNEAENVHNFQPKSDHHSGSKGHSSLNFNVEGNMTVELGFCVGGEKVDITVNENEGLVITMASGAKFTVPLGDGSQRKAS